MKILVSGLINLENNVRVKNFPIEYSPIEYAFNDVEFHISGVGYNVMCALNALGDNVLPITLIGRDFIGDMIKSKIESLGISTDFVLRYLSKTCTSTVLFDNKGKRKIYCDLKNIQDEMVSFEDVDKKIDDCDGYVICNINFNDEIINKVRRYGKPVFCDVHVLSNINDEYNRRFMMNSDVLFLSHEGIKGNHEDFLISIYKKYHNKIIVLGQGKVGALLLDGNTHEVVSIPSVDTREVVNTVGAGDALFSSFIHFYLKGLSPIDSLKRAMTFASYKIGESGGAKGFINERTLDSIYKTLELPVYKVKNF